MKSKFLLSLMAMVLLFGFTACSSDDKHSIDSAKTNFNEEINTVMSPYIVSEWAQYEHANFNLSYPKDWERQENVYGTVVAILSPVVDGDLFSENCNVIIDDNEESIKYSAKDYFNASIDSLSSFITGYEEIARGEINIADKEAYYIAYSGVQGEYNLFWIQYLSKGEANHYILTCTAMKDTFSAYKGAFDEIATKMLIK